MSGEIILFRVVLPTRILFSGLSTSVILMYTIKKHYQYTLFQVHIGWGECIGLVSHQVELV